HWLNDPDANSTAPDGGAVNPARRGKAPLPELPPATGRAADQVAAAQQAWAHTLQQAGLEKKDGSSNAIALAPRLTTDSRALLLGGPQMGYAAPQVNHEIGIHGAGYDVTGMQIAGWPGPPIGVGSNFAWSLTSGGSDNTDMYVEVLNPSDPTQYLFEGEWQDLDCRSETIGVAGAPDVDQPICRSVHGPVMGQAPGVAITLKNATFGHEIDSMDAWMSLGRAQNLAEFEESLAEIWYNFNVLYADDRGNIGSWHIGRIPIRTDGDNPWLPHLGTGDSEWQGFVDWPDMPHALNPDQGFLTSWNNKPAPGWSNSSAGFWLWGPVHRVNTLFNLLEAIEPGTASVETLETINRTAGFTTQQPSANAGTVVVSTLLGDLLTEVDEAADPRLPQIVDLLAAWDWLQEDEDGNELYDSPAVAIFNTWWEHAASDIFGDELGGFADSTVVGNLMYRLLHDDAALPLMAEYLDGVTASDALTAALVGTLDQLTIDYGSADPATWLQPIAEIVWAPTGVGTVPNTIWMNRGTYNQIVHLGPGPHLWGQNVISPGQSGDAFSPHFDDQLELYATWQYKPMRLTRNDLRGHTESTERLRLP
ncbi:MAG: penicillin acylase family protein, partial [Actinomycetota bacterium]|nr:penicillin acylase family protein [Actinomycetota bacterium]